MQLDVGNEPYLLGMGSQFYNVFFSTWTRQDGGGG